MITKLISTESSRKPTIAAQLISLQNIRVFVSNLELPQTPWLFKSSTIENSVGFRVLIYMRHASENSTTLYVVSPILTLSRDYPIAF